MKTSNDPTTAAASVSRVGAATRFTLLRVNRRDGSGEERVMENAPRRYGRGLFLATVAGGLSSLAWGRPVWSKVSSALAPAEQLVPFVPQSGWRIYTVSGSMPSFDPATWRLHVGALVGHGLDLDYAELRAV